MQNLPLEEKSFLRFINNISLLKLSILYPIFIISRIPVWFVIMFMYLRYNSISSLSLILFLSAIFISRSYLEHLITGKKVSYFILSRFIRFFIEIALLIVVIYAYGNFIFNIEKIQSIDILFLIAALTIPALLKWNVNKSPWLGYHLKVLPLIVITYLWILISLNSIPFYIKIFAFILIQITELYNLIYENHIGNKIKENDNSKGIYKLIPNIFRSKKNKIVIDKNNMFSSTTFEKINDILFANIKNDYKINKNIKLNKVYNTAKNSFNDQIAHNNLQKSSLSVPNQFISFSPVSKSIDADLVRKICFDINNYRKINKNIKNKGTDIILNQSMLTNNFKSISFNNNANVFIEKTNTDNIQKQSLTNYDVEDNLSNEINNNSSNSILNEYSIFNVDYNISSKNNDIETENELDDKLEENKDDKK